MNYKNKIKNKNDIVVALIAYIMLFVSVSCGKDNPIDVDASKDKEINDLKKEKSALAQEKQEWEDADKAHQSEIENLNSTVTEIDNLLSAGNADEAKAKIKELFANLDSVEAARAKEEKEKLDYFAAVERLKVEVEGLKSSVKKLNTLFADIGELDKLYKENQERDDGELKQSIETFFTKFNDAIQNEIQNEIDTLILKINEAVDKNLSDSMQNLFFEVE